MPGTEKSLALLVLLQTLPKLWRLDLSYTKVTTEVLDVLQEFPKLKEASVYPLPVPLPFGEWSLPGGNRAHVLGGGTLQRRVEDPNAGGQRREDGDGARQDANRAPGAGPPTRRSRKTGG